jgi:hypothetical protein
MAGGMDGDTAGRWLSYAELAEVRGTDKHSALKLALRKRWPRRKGNHGTMQVCVPPEWLSEWTRKSDGMPPGTASDMASPTAPIRADGVDIGGIIGAFETATALLTKRAEAAESRADAMQQARDEANKRADVAVALADRTLAQLTDANARVDQTLALLAEATTRPDRFRDERDQARTDAQEARQAADQLRRERDNAEADAAQLREAMQKAEHDRAAAVVIADEAVRATEELRQVDAARAGQGRWARLRAAWRGE